MINGPLVSVLMCVYNADKYLDSAIQSIILQSYKNIEFIIIDDGSEKRTKDILNQYLNVARIKVYHKQHCGLTKSLNYGLSKCTGKYIARQDADDISDVNRISEQVEYLENSVRKPTICGSYIYIFNNKFKREKKNPISNINIKRNLFFRNCIAHGSVMFSRSIINDYFFYNENLTCAQDYELWRNLMDRVYYYNIPKYLYWYRSHETAISNNHRIKQRLNSILISLFGFFKIGRKIRLKYL